MEVAGFKGKNEEGWNDRIEESVGEDVIVFSDTDIRRGKRQKSVKRSPGRGAAKGLSHDSTESSENDSRSQSLGIVTT